LVFIAIDNVIMMSHLSG